MHKLRMRHLIVEYISNRYWFYIRDRFASEGLIYLVVMAVSCYNLFPFNITLLLFFTVTGSGVSRVNN
jgi:membrane-anchored protein YejM (alkaline phosphatase superfamily)